MMLESSDDKIKQICDEISIKTIRPAKIQAKEILEDAKLKAQGIIDEANEQKEQLLKEAANEVMQKNNVANASLNMAIKQSIAKLKQQIVEKLFSKELETLLQNTMNNETIVAQIIEVMLTAINKQGVDANLGAALSSGVDKQKVYAALSSSVKDRLDEQNIVIGSFKAGAQVVIREKNLCLDLSDDAVKELLSEYVLDDLKEKIFEI